jgi:hypothetical protein
MTPQEVEYLLAAPNASGGYVLPGTVYNSNGNYCSTTQVNVSVAQNNLFPDLTGPQNAAQQVDYQCVFVYNSDLTSTMVNVMAWIPSSSVTSGAVNWALAADPTGVSNYNAVSAQALLIANPQVAPAGITLWTAPSANFTTGVSLGTIGPRQVFPIWIRRSATGVAAPIAGFNLQVTFDA